MTELLPLIPYKYPKKESQIKHDTGEEQKCLNEEKTNNIQIAWGRGAAEVQLKNS